MNLNKIQPMSIDFDRKFFKKRMTEKRAAEVEDNNTYQFYGWYTKIWNSLQARPSVMTVVQRMIKDNLQGDVVHDFFKYQEYTGVFTVYYQTDWTEPINTNNIHKQYAYSGGRFDRYWIYNKEGNCVKTAEPIKYKMLDNQIKTNEDTDNFIDNGNGNKYPDWQDELSDIVKDKPIVTGIEYDYKSASSKVYIEDRDLLLLSIKKGEKGRYDMNINFEEIDKAITSLEDAIELLKFIKEKHNE